MLDELCTSGDVVWVGAGALGARDGRIRLCFADQLAAARTVVGAARSARGSAARGHPRDCSAAQGASFWGQLRAAAPASTDSELLAALWDLVWAGEVTNDSLAPLRAVLGGASPKAAAAHGRGTAPRAAATRAG